MPDQSTPRPGRRPGRVWIWRLGTPVVLLTCGALFVASAIDSDGTDLRPGRSTDLSSVVSTESRDVEALKQRATTLSDDVQRLTSAVDDEQVDKLTQQVRSLEPAAGRTAVNGPGVTVTLSDAPASIREQSSEDSNLFVVHQQDIQAVVNALWLGGARAVTLQGQRLITTTGIKCSGNVVRLHGIPYANPYVVQAVGDPARLQQALDDSSYLAVYREQSADPTIGVGWSTRTEARVAAPAYAGPLDLAYATVATDG